MANLIKLACAAICERQCSWWRAKGTSREIVFEGYSHRNFFLGIEIFTTVSFHKTVQNPAQCKLDDHDTIITKLDNENDTGRISENMRRHKECYLVPDSERTFATG